MGGEEEEKNVCEEEEVEDCHGGPQVSLAVHQEAGAEEGKAQQFNASGC